MDRQTNRQNDMKIDIDIIHNMDKLSTMANNCKNTGALCALIINLIVIKRDIQTGKIINNDMFPGYNLLKHAYSQKQQQNLDRHDQVMSSFCYFEKVKSSELKVNVNAGSH